VRASVMARVSDLRWTVTSSNFSHVVDRPDHRTYASYRAVRVRCWLLF